MRDRLNNAVELMPCSQAIRAAFRRDPFGPSVSAEQLHQPTLLISATPGRRRMFDPTRAAQTTGFTLTDDASVQHNQICMYELTGPVAVAPNLNASLILLVMVV